MSKQLDLGDAPRQRSTERVRASILNTPADPNCAFAWANPSHECRNRDGQPLRAGQCCAIGARLDLLVSRSDR